MAANDETYNLGVETLKKSQTLCPFTVGTYQYDATDVAPTNYLCWFKSENFLAQSKNGKLDPLTPSAMWWGISSSALFTSACRDYKGEAHPGVEFARRMQKTFARRRRG